MTPSFLARILSLAVVSVAAFGAVALVSTPAHAQRVYVYYGRPAPPPPPPPGGYYAGPAPAPYVYREPAQAFVLGGDLEGAVPLSMPQTGNNTVQGGIGFKIRFGEQFRFPGVRVTPEVGYGFDHLFARDADSFLDTPTYTQDLHRVFGGVRLAFGRVLVPVLYAHGGFGWRGTDDPSLSGNDNGFMFDVGGAIDFHVVPHFSFGAHLEYDEIFTPNDPPKWLGVGGHAAIVF